MCSRAAKPCPLQGTGVVYLVTVTTSSDSIPTETYTGLTGRPFKARYTGDMASMRHLTKKTAQRPRPLQCSIWPLREADHWSKTQKVNPTNRNKLLVEQSLQTL